MRDNKNDGISCDQKSGHVFLACFGAIFLAAGILFTVKILPQALADGEYPALFMLLFIVAGIWLMTIAIKGHLAYKKLGPTPLRLDPASPGVGGQLGGTVTIDYTGELPGSSASFMATVTCTKQSGSGKHRSYSILWQQDVPVYLEQTANGLEARFLGEIPDDCSPDKEYGDGFAIAWSVVITGNPGDAVKFDRSWSVPLSDTAAQASSALKIPTSFLRRAKDICREHAEKTALAQIPLTENNEYVELTSKAGRHLIPTLMVILTGAAFAGMGYVGITKDVGIAYLFLFIGIIVLVLGIYKLGNSIDVKIDKKTNVLHTRRSWFGLVYSYLRVELQTPKQFEIKHTSSDHVGSRITEYYAVSCTGGGKTIRVADRIKGRQAAEALKHLIIARCFKEEPEQLAA